MRKNALGPVASLSRLAKASTSEQLEAAISAVQAVLQPFVEVPGSHAAQQEATWLVQVVKTAAAKLRTCSTANTKDLASTACTACTCLLNSLPAKDVATLSAMQAAYALTRTLVSLQLFQQALDQSLQLHAVVVGNPLPADRGALADISTGAALSVAICAAECGAVEHGQLEKAGKAVGCLVQQFRCVQSMDKHEHCEALPRC